MPELHVVFVPLLIVRRIAVIAIPAEQQHITYFYFLQIFKQTVIPNSRSFIVIHKGELSH